MVYIYIILIGLALSSTNDSLSVYFDQNNHLKVVEIADNSIVESNKLTDQSYKRASESAMRLDELDKAIKFLKEAIKISDKKEYRDEWDKIVSMRKDIEIALKRYTDQGEFQEAIDEFFELKNKYPDCALIEYNIGKINQQEDRFNEALKHFKLAIELNPYREKYQLSLNYVVGQYIIEGDEYASMRDFETARDKYLEALLYKTNDSMILFKLAKTFYFLKNYTKAAENLEILVSESPDHFEAFRLLGDVYKKEDNYDLALESYLRAIEINDMYEKAYLSVGQIYYARGSYDQALEYCEMAIEKKNNYSKAYEMIGMIYEVLENYTKSIYYYEETIRFDKRNYKTMSRLASVYNLLSNHEVAKKHSKDCIKIKRNYAPAYYELGIAEKGLGNRISAIDAFEKAAKDSRWRKAAKYEIEEIKSEL